MFGFLINLLALWEQSKQRALKKKNDSANRLKLYIDTKVSALKGNTETATARELSASKVKVRVLSLLSILIGFFETLPLFFSAMYILILLMCTIGVMIIIMMITSLVGNLFDEIAKGFKPPTIEESLNPTGGKAQWTEDELAKRGTLLTDYEKNMYRLVMLSKKALNGYGGPNLVSDYDPTMSVSLPLAVGISSTETSMNFYAGGKQLDITKIPSDIPANGKGYGFLGISKDATLEGYTSSLKLKSEILTNIKTSFKPESTPLYDATYAPWGTAMSAMHLYRDINAFVHTDLTKTKMDKAMDVFGIKENREELKAYLACFLAQAEYHGADTSEYQDYLNFWCALYALTSEEDKERSFDKWGIVYDGYDEHTVRKIVLGTSSHFEIDNYATPNNLPQLNTNAYFTLNGNRINEALWSYVYKEYGSKQEIKDAWNRAVEFAGYSDSTHDRVINFHYGFNSYLQGTKIMKNVASKLTGPSAGAFAETPGQGQGTWDGKTIEEYIKSKSAHKDTALSFQKHWGRETYIKPQKISDVDWEPDKWGVPYYRQAWGDEPYSLFPWAGSLGGSTFDYSGCMVYSFAYSASALTGKMINPPEMASALWVNGALKKGEGVQGNNEVVNTFKSLGLNVQVETLNGFVRGDAFNIVWTKIEQALDNNGVVVVQSNRNAPARWSGSANHFFVITDKKSENGNTMYRVYNSTNIGQTVKWFDKSKFEGSIYSRSFLVTK